ncbi:MAG: hypothetical protein K1X74_16910 [Pirellulales bacterium]|nr:hypothetical protein [Pirellulales bacterium]
MNLRLTTLLDTSAPRAWDALLCIETFTEVTRGLLGFRVLEGPPPTGNWEPGARWELRIYLAGLLPAWRHELSIIAIDPGTLTMRTRERGGPLRVWNHTLHLAPIDEQRCRYTDEVEIDAGLMTPLAWLIASVFFRYRQWRWRRLARRLAATAV